MGTAHPFDATRALSDDQMAELCSWRAGDPWAARRASVTRCRRSLLTEDGHLVILACDHPARGVLAAGGDPLAMANRRGYLARILRALGADGVDGVMATPDIVEDLLVLGERARDSTGASPLDDVLLIGCLNRGGIAGTVFELDDRPTAFTLPGIQALGLDGAKAMVRIADDAPESGRTLAWAAEAANQCAEAGLPLFLEPLPVRRTETGWETVATWQALSRAAAIASALGTTSSGTWLKLPYCDAYHCVAGATTLPLLMLGGSSRGEFVGLLGEIASAMAAGPNVRGAMIGRNVLFPSSGADPRDAARAVSAVVHERLPAAEAAGLWLGVSGGGPSAEE